MKPQEPSEPSWAIASVRARSSRGVRGRAGALLVACTLSLACLGAYAWRNRIDVSRTEITPVTVPAPTWRALRAVASMTETACPPPVPLAVIYVTRSCPHCRAELGRWASFVRSGTELSCIGVVVVARRTASDTSRDWLPPALTSMLLWDRDGAIGNALGVRLVPSANYITSRGSLMSRAIGEQSDSSTKTHLIELRRTSGENGGRR